MAESLDQSIEADIHAQPQDDKVVEEWAKEQEELRCKIIAADCESWQRQRLIDHNDTADDSDNSDSDEASELVNNVNALTLTPDEVLNSRPLQYVAGVDLSFLKNETTACAALVVCRLPSLKVVYEDFKLHEVTVPYIAGYLSFRETAPLVEAFERLKETSPQYIPQAILVDGNGLLHYREAGLACHLGVTVNIPTVGVAKNLLAVDALVKNEEHKEKIINLQKTGDSFPLSKQTGKVLGMAVKTCEGAQNPVYVSIGHQISLETAVWLVLQCSKFRIPEPIRQADQRSRSYLRKNFPDLFPSEKKKSPSKKNSCTVAEV